MLFAGYGNVSAHQGFNVAGGGGVTVNEWSVCQRVNNNGGWPAVFVPTNSAAEWSNFRSYKPSHVGLANCLPANATISLYERSCGATPRTFNVGTISVTPGTFTTATGKNYTVSVDGPYVRMDCWRSPMAATPGLNVVAVGLTVPGYSTIWASYVAGYTLGSNGIAASAADALGPPAQVGPYTYPYYYGGKWYYYTDCTWMGDTSSSLTVGFSY